MPSPETQRPPARAVAGEADAHGQARVQRSDGNATAVQTSSLVARWKSACRAAADSHLSRVDLAVHVVILDHMSNATGVAWPSAETVARAVGATVRAVRKARHRLVARGHLNETTASGRPNRYRIGTPDVQVAPGTGGTPERQFTPERAFTPERQFPDPCTGVHPTPELAFPGPLNASSPELALEATSLKNQKKEPDKKLRSRVARAVDSGFDRFWEKYPRKEAKENAEKAWRQVEGGQHVDAILEDLTRSIEGCRWSEKKFTPLPATYLRGKRWLDEWQPETLAEKVRRSAEDFGNYQFGSAPTPSEATAAKLNERAERRLQPSVSDSFAGKTYTGTSDADLPDHLRTDVAP